MAITILPKEQSLGGIFGSSLGSGVQSGLQALAQAKVNQLKKQQQVSPLQELFGPKGGEVFYNLSPDEKKIVLNNPELLQNLLDLNVQKQTGGIFPPSLMNQQQNQDQQQVGEPLSQTDMDIMDELGIKYSSQDQPIAAEEIQYIQPAQGSLNKTRAQRIAEGQKSPQLKLAEDKFSEEKLARMDKKEREAFKETKADRKEILTNALGAEEELQNLNRMEELADTGNLDSSAWNEFLKAADLDIAALRSPESQEFLKIRQSFLKDAKKYFGARVSNFEVEQFLKTIPDLSQSPEGMKRVIANLKRFNRLKIAQRDAMKKIIKKNGGIPPLDLLEQVDDKMSKYADKVAKQFKKDLKRPVPKSEEGILPAIGKVAGTVLKNIPRAATQAGAGYLAGQKLLGPGAGLVGAGIGALSGLAGYSPRSLL